MTIPASLGRLRDHVTQTVRRNVEEGAVFPAVNVFGLDGPGLRWRPLDLGKCHFDIVYFEETALLRGVAAILCQSDLDTIAREDGPRIR